MAKEKVANLQQIFNSVNGELVKNDIFNKSNNQIVKSNPKENTDYK